VVERRVRLCAAAALLAAQLACQGPLNERLENLFYTPYLELDLARNTPELIPPEGLRVTSSEDRQVGLAWNPVLVGDVAGYAISRAERQDGDYSIVGRTVGRFAAVYNDLGEGPMKLGDGKTYHYRVYPFDGEGRLSRDFATVSARTEPQPSSPPNLQAYSNLPRRVALSWESSASGSVVGYAVYRSPSLAGTFDQVAFVDGRLNTVYEDPVPGDLRVMYYKIQAVNRFGGASELSEAVRGVTKPEPLPPTGLEATTPMLGQVDLHWTPNVEPDLNRYQIWRQSADGEPRPYASVAAGTTGFSDRSVDCAERLRYQLRAIDGDGLESALSPAVEIDTLDLALELAQGPSGQELRWQPERTQGWPALRIVERRPILPDVELGITRTDTFLPVRLGPGTHWLAATLTHRVAGAERTGAGDPPRDAPTCLSRIEIP
jgi:fibronectin type 3 domain-containing protein